ncbi:MAG: prephenate dehydrogenase [Candidatus Izemoplasmatales bacterium]|jgi:prephenate dehydrogenase|nr:prephenate dehydrogenase [Candidatus Izemoplasmatales bacterium]
MNIGIVGLGLMGGSIAMALKEKHTVFAYDRSPENSQYGLDHLLINEVCPDVARLGEKADIVYLCLYPEAISPFIKSNQKYFRPNTILIDISGTKSRLVSDLSPLIRDDLDLIFTHPIAGKEKTGVRFADKQIFTNQNYVIVPTPKNQSDHLSLVEQLALDMGFKTISYLSADEHDEIIAFTSQLCHVLALALMEAAPKKYPLKKFVGDSFRDLTRVAMINTPLWQELFLDNKANLINQIDTLVNALEKYRKAIKNHDRVKLVDMMEKAKYLRLQMEKEVTR